jgi:hypothetical protein
VVVWRKDLYIAEANRQLSDHRFYKRLDVDLTLVNNKLVAETISIEIDRKKLPKEALNLVHKKPRCSTLYFLPKIHKLDTPGRPIVSNINCPTEHLSHYLSDILQPLVDTLPSFIKDTTQFLKKLQNFKFESKKNPIIFTMDIKSLYTVIPNNEGLRALRIFLDKRRSCVPPTSTLVRLAQLVLETNCFEFNDKFYQQIGGVCMGTRMGPTYACLFMGFLENRILDQYKGKKPSLYLRYIDDIFCAGNLNSKETTDFITFFNNFNNNIEVSSNVGQSVPFLDTVAKIESDHITTSLHYKDTDSHLYVHYHSEHPRQCKDNIPFSQMLRAKRICSSQVDFESHASKLKSFFNNRSYPENVVFSAYSRASVVDREQLLDYKSNEGLSRIPLVLTFNRETLPVVKIVQHFFSILQSHPTTESLFMEKPLLSYRRDKNLKDKLVTKVLNKPQHINKVVGTFPCGRSRCKTCKHTSNTPLLTGPKGSFNVRQHFTCTGVGVVYAIVCAKCGDLYIEETERKLADRFREHLNFAVKLDISKSTVAQHFSLPNHSYTDMQVLGLLHCKSTNNRKLQEKRLIYSLGTLIPLGMNTRGENWPLISLF